MPAEPLADQFAVYQSLRPDRIEGIYRDSLIVIDTNVIDQLYKVSPAARETLLSNLEALASRLWMPHQVGLEYHRNLDDFRKNSNAALTEFARNQTDLITKFMSAMDAIAEAYPEQTFTEEREAIAANMAKITDDTKTIAADNAPSDVHDDIYRRLNDLYPHGRIGKAFTAKELTHHRAEGFARQRNNVPPGLKDEKKAGDHALGDYFLWVQIITHVTANPADVIFVTKDLKSDWWKVAGKVARPDLVEEFIQLTGRQILLQTPAAFVKSSSKYLRKNDAEAESAALQFRKAFKTDFDSDLIGLLDELGGAVVGFYKTVHDLDGPLGLYKELVISGHSPEEAGRLQSTMTPIFAAFPTYDEFANRARLLQSVID